MKKQDEQTLKWKYMHQVTYSEHERVIICKNGWRALLRLYCSEENYNGVVETVKKQSVG